MSFDFYQLFQNVKALLSFKKDISFAVTSDKPMGQNHMFFIFDERRFDSTKYKSYMSFRFYSVRKIFFGLRRGTQLMDEVTTETLDCLP